MPPEPRQNKPAPNPIILLLLREGVLTKQQVEYTQRVASKLHDVRSLCEIAEELGYVTEEQLQSIVRKYQGELRIGDLLNGLGYLSDENLRQALEAEPAAATPWPWAQLAAAEIIRIFGDIQRVVL